MGKKRPAQDIATTNTQREKTDHTGDVTPSNSNEKKKRKKRSSKKKNANKIIKDPNEAHSYLSLWQQQQQKLNNTTFSSTNSTSSCDNDQQLTVIWRFNKNTQSWLLRHMYNVNKIPKNTFSILLLYIEDLKGGSRQRVYDDAVRRAMRYKEWEKKISSSSNSNNENANTHDDENSNPADDGDDKNNEKDHNEDEDDENMDEKKWNSLNDHDKRKEYKRARKVIDVLKRKSE